ncbi:MAG: hypothetical protein K9K78_08130 [Spirochaetales bacterium]|nr:hypothetical protein [Spirochaetales bacterium]
MVQRGSARGISCFGTGDHNHNLTDAKWISLIKDTEKMRALYPNFQFLTNCELTFRFGHALLLSPKHISGTIAEAYSYLFRSSEAMLIINHPYIDSDQWRGSIIPHAGGIEVINGSVLQHGETQKNIELMLQSYEEFRIIDFPHVSCYADYLSHGVPVLPFGNSDAHSLEEIGSGVTGFRHETLEEAIEARALFAATDTGIRLNWEYVQKTRAISYEAAFDPLLCSGDDLSGDDSSGDDSENYPFKIQCYCDRTLVSSQITSTAPSGTIIPARRGYYWFAVQKGRRFAISAPVLIGQPISPKGIYAFPLDLQRQLYFERQDLIPAPLKKTSTDPDAKTAYKCRLFGSSSPKITDAAGQAIPYELEPADKDIVMNKTGDPQQLQEFFTWLDRNEIHEYKFARLDYSIDASGELQLRALLLPALFLPEGYCDDEVRTAGNTIYAQLDTILRVKLFLEIPPLNFTRLWTDSNTQFPLTVQDGEWGIESCILFFPEGTESCCQQITKIYRKPI